MMMALTRLSLSSMLKVVVLVSCVLLLSITRVVAEQPIPALRSPVTDTTNTLTPAQRSALEARLLQFERNKGAQIALLIVSTTAPETIEQYSLRVVEQWKLGRATIDDGALLIVAIQDRDLRIETGYGLEGVLSDVVSHRIIEEQIVPHFRIGNYAEGIQQGIEAMITVVSGETLPAPSWSRSTRQGTQNSLENFGVLIVVMALFLSGITRSLFGKFGGSFFAALAAFLAGLMLWSLFAGIAIGVISFILSLLHGVSPGRGGRGYYSGGRGFGGGGFSGGGFRGGGGSFGGGGASGRW